MREFDVTRRIVREFHYKVLAEDEQDAENKSDELAKANGEDFEHATDATVEYDIFCPVDNKPA